MLERSNYGWEYLDVATSALPTATSIEVIIERRANNGNPLSTTRISPKRRVNEKGNAMFDETVANAASNRKIIEVAGPAVNFLWALV